MIGLPVEVEGAFGASDSSTHLAAALQAVRSYCGWHIGPVVTETLAVDGDGATSVNLPTLRLVSVTSLTVDGVTAEADSFEWAEDGRLRRSGGFGYKLLGVRAVVEHGLDGFPDDVAAVVCSLAGAGVALSGAGLLRQVGQVAYDTAGRASGGVDVLALSHKAILDKYKLPPC